MPVPWGDLPPPRQQESRQRPELLCECGRAHGPRSECGGGPPQQKDRPGQPRRSWPPCPSAGVASQGCPALRQGWS